MSLKDKSTRLYEYISQVYSIDLPVDRNVTEYRAELWWQANLTPSLQCKIKNFDSGSNNDMSENQEESLGGDSWLSVTKRQCDYPPELPYILKEWIELSSNPTKVPSAKATIVTPIDFEADKKRVSEFNNYVKLWKESSGKDLLPKPEALIGWIDEALPTDMPPVHIARREVEVRFESDKSRLAAFNEYIDSQWKSWSERVTPLFKANILYDELFALHQRLSVEGDRIEIIWGHLFLAWNHSIGKKVYHPLIITPMNLNFDPLRRNISLTPSQTIPTKVDLDCLLNLDYPNKDELLKYIRQINNAEIPPEVWNHTQMRGFAATITGYLSTESAEKTNLYSEKPISQPTSNPFPTIHNSPVIFVRERTRRLWIEDAKKVAEAIYKGADIPPFIRALVADSHELPNPEDYAEKDNAGESESENLLPLEYNDQQKEIAEKLKKHFGVLVQGPPGTGKSHTIANIVSSLLASGKRVLVTSQTENALRVLRDYIPHEIRSLCVSQLGNDTEAKKQLNEAVDSIGKRLSEKNSQVIEQKIQQIRKELRRVREEQAILRNKIREWAELDSCFICISGENVSAHLAAKECSENEADHAWFPDKLAPLTETPLSNNELLELCTLIQIISPSDRAACLKSLPVIEQLLNSDDFSGKILKYRSLKSIAAETENLRLDWGAKLSSAQLDDVKSALKIQEEALLTMQGLNHSWQIKILDSMVSESRQETFWRDFLEKCIHQRDLAWKAYQLIQGYKITLKELPVDLDTNAALEELSRTIRNGKNPSNWLTRLLLSNSAKLLFDSIKVDDHTLITEERITIARAYFDYKTLLTKISTIWNQTICDIGGASIDIQTPMPLVYIDGLIKNVHDTVEWVDNFHEQIKKTLFKLGCRKQDVHKQSTIEEALRILNGQVAEFDKQYINKEFEEYYKRLFKESQKENVHAIWGQLAMAVQDHSVDNYVQLYNERLRLFHLEKKVQRLENLSSMLRNVAPIWSCELEKKALEMGVGALVDDWEVAWRWGRLNKWLYYLHARESVDSLQTHLERARKKEHELVIQLVSMLTWQRQIANVEDRHYQALTAWANAMRRYGKGTGKHAQRYLSDAAKAMINAVGAVPAWIMPLHRVVQSFAAKPNIFDVIIIDEASQCDLRALSVLFRARKVLVVGDPEQISPANVGIDRDKVFELLRQFLSDIPYAETTFNIDSSLYEITRSIPRMNRTLLTEHFRCVPQIIEFNNHLCPSYDGRLEPLRQPNPQERLEPHIQTVFVENGFKNNNDINEPEAEALVELLVKCCRDERYASGGKNNCKRTMGVISLLGDKQAKYISELIAQRLDETEREERRIICGDAYAFQGDERDVMFLSLVVASNAPFRALNGDADRQRFNVATSRARDQVFLFHSVKLDNIKNPECVRYKILQWYLNPPIAEMESDIEDLKRKADSDFEIQVGERIIKRGYKIIPQYKPFPSDFNYRIDLVIQGDRNRVAVECDGERWHGPEKWEYDQRREAQLRRAGWKFWRISGSAFYRNKDRSLDGLWLFLETEGITSQISNL